MTETRYPGGAAILRALKFYTKVIEEINAKTDEEIAKFSVTNLIASRIEGLTESAALDIFEDLKVLVQSLDVFGQAFGFVGKEKFRQGASNVS